MTTHSILIVDDQPLVAQALGAMLVRFGHHVAGIATSASEASARIAEGGVDLVMMDAILRNDACSDWLIPVVVMTTHTDEAALLRAGVTEPYGYVAKPLVEREVRINVDLALCKHTTQREARELEHRFFALNIDLLCFHGFDGHFKRLNPAWERTLGFTCDELMARPAIEFVHPDDRERTLAQNREVRGGGKALAFENRYLCKDGSFRWLLWNASADTGQQVIYSVARDITARRAAEAERDRLVHELQAALAEVRSLQAILPICSYCRKIRDDENYWETVEGYVSRHTNTRFSHSICPECFVREVEPMLDELERK